jgi:hypothetical protein
VSETPASRPGLRLRFASGADTERRCLGTARRRGLRVKPCAKKVSARKGEQSWTRGRHEHRDSTRERGSIEFCDLCVEREFNPRGVAEGPVRSQRCPGPPRLLAGWRSRALAAAGLASALFHAADPVGSVLFGVLRGLLACGYRLVALTARFRSVSRFPPLVPWDPSPQ